MLYGENVVSPLLPRPIRMCRRGGTVRSPSDANGPERGGLDRWAHGGVQDDSVVGTGRSPRLGQLVRRRHPKQLGALIPKVVMFPFQVPVGHVSYGDAPRSLLGHRYAACSNHVTKVVLRACRSSEPPQSPLTSMFRRCVSPGWMQPFSL